jgi:hypothetical protein
MNCQEGCQGLYIQTPSKILGVLNRVQTAKGIPTRVLCQKNKRTVKTEQKAVTVGDRLLTGHCHLERHLFKMRLTKSHL